MLESRPDQFTESLHELGIGTGDGLLIHSSLQMLGRPVGGVDMYRTMLQSLVGEEGTLVVPTFTLNFPKTRFYDARTTPSQGMGTFSEHIRTQPGARRTTHPMQSLAVLGWYAKDLTDRDTLSAFESGSAFERMLELDFKLLLLGADVQAVSMVHYCETRAAVPYRIWKDFPGKLWQDDRWVERSYRMYARDLDINPVLVLEPIREHMLQANLWKEVPYNYGKLATCRLKDFAHVTDRLLSDDPWILVGNRQDVFSKLRSTDTKRT